ncbi:MAG: ribosome biogenesis GTPase Der [Acidobacteria bacterium]|nr:ribosome biogenesis GTPase Der [Acidobacteriota bacterium]
MTDPVVVLLGAPNVGKSTLFNRLRGGRRALVHPQPGMTRDRLSRPAVIEERRVLLVDTGGVINGAGDAMSALIRDQSHEALVEADVVVLVVDGRAGCSGTDRDLARLIRRRGLPVVIAVNKLDTERLETHASEFHELGLEPVLSLSAAHGLGLHELKKQIAERLPASLAAPREEAPELSLALIGRPNVGKSSLLNRLVNQERVIVSDQPGTTRDSIDTLLRAHQRTFRLVDTAGLRRREAAADAAESLAIAQARHALARAQVAVLVMDARAGVTVGDLAVAGEAMDAGRAVIPVLNKWDLVSGGEDQARALLEEVANRLSFLPYSRPLTVSALTGLRVRRLLQEALLSEGEFMATRPTAAWNRALQSALKERRTPLVENRPFRIRYAVQTGTGPPRVTLFVNRQTPLPPTYMRFLAGRLGMALDLTRTPIRLQLRSREAAGKRRRPADA